MARYLIATYGAFAIMGSTLYAFGVGIAVERGLGWLEVKRASPMPLGAYFFAKGAVADGVRGDRDPAAVRAWARSSGTCAWRRRSGC